MAGRQRLPRAAKAQSAYGTFPAALPVVKPTTAGSKKRKESIQLPSPAPTKGSWDERSSASLASTIELMEESSSVSVEPLSDPAAQTSAISTTEQQDQRELPQADIEPPTKKRRTTRAAAQRRSTAPATDLVFGELEHAEDVDSGVKPAMPKKGRRSKRGPRIKTIINKKKKTLKNPRRVKFPAKLGFTPWPEHEAPSPEECYEANRRLVKAHGASDRPQKLVNDNSVSGCGEVPHVLDALLRTVLSAATTNKNSANAFQGVIKRFGLVDEAGRAIAAPAPENSQDLDQVVNIQEETTPGEDESAPNSRSVVEDSNEQLFIKTGLGTVNWYAVRNTTIADLEASITCGGLGLKKSNQIKDILNRVWEEEIMPNLGDTSVESIPEGKLTLDFLAALDHLRDVKDMEGVRQKLQSYVGVGLKTATCVMCMCLGHDVFAVDTHVHRIAKWLGWVPPTASLEHACFHLDLKIPNELKYSLHNLLIRHGRSCAECKGSPEKPEKKIGKDENSDEKPDEKPITPKAKVRKASVRKAKVKLDEGGNPIKLKRTKKVWTGNGLMKETIVEVETDAEGGEEDNKCCLEDLLKRERKPRKLPKRKSTSVPPEDMPEEDVDKFEGGLVKDEVVRDQVLGDEVVVTLAVE